MMEAPRDRRGWGAGRGWNRVGGVGGWFLFLSYRRLRAGQMAEVTFS